MIAFHNLNNHKNSLNLRPYRMIWTMSLHSISNCTFSKTGFNYLKQARTNFKCKQILIESVYELCDITPLISYYRGNNVKPIKMYSNFLPYGVIDTTENIKNEKKYHKKIIYNILKK